MATPHHVRHEAGMLSASSDSNGNVNVDKLTEQYAQVLSNLRVTFNSGKTKDVEWRKQQVKGVRLAFAECVDDIARALKLDLGRHLHESVLAETVPCIQECDFVLENIDSWVAPERVSHPLLLQPGSSELHYTPKGVVFVLAPWNYPINLAFMSILAAISAGNCVIVKPSEVAPECALVIEKMVYKYLDTDCIKVVQGAVPETTALLRLPFDHILYTGNGAVGRIVASAAAKHLTPITLELGGKSPTYVDPSCNMTVTANRLLQTKCLNNGQTCIAPDHVFVHKSVEKAFTKALIDAAQTFFGKETAESESYGRIVNQRHFDRIVRLMDQDKHKGQIIYGGLEKASREKKLIPLTFVLNPALDSPLMEEEIFGPVLPIITVSGVEEAVQIINSREHPLALYCYAEDQAVCDKLIGSTQSGGVCVNDGIFHIANPHLPFGGVGASGMGAYHGVHGFKELSHKRAVMYRSTWIDPSIRYPPYSESKARAVLGFATKEPMSAGTKKLLLIAGLGAALYSVSKL